MISRICSPDGVLRAAAGLLSHAGFARRSTPWGLRRAGCKGRRHNRCGVACAFLVYMPSPLPRHSDLSYCFAHFVNRRISTGRRVLQVRSDRGCRGVLSSRAFAAMQMAPSRLMCISQTAMVRRSRPVAARRCCGRCARSAPARTPRSIRQSGQYRSGREINLARMLANDTPQCLAGPAKTPVSPAYAAVLLSAAL